MVGRLAGVIAASSALTAQAFLIPAGIQSLEESSALTVVNADWQAVKLSCPECVFPAKQADVKESAEDDTMWIQGGANSLMLNVSTILGGNAIGLGDYTLYPPLASYQKGQIDMVRSDASMVGIVDGSAERAKVTITADTSMVNEAMHSSNDDAVIRISYQIVAIDNHPVTVDSVDIAAFKRNDGKMAIISVETHTKATAFHPLPVGHKTPASRPCAFPTTVCHVRDVLEAKIKEIQAKVHGKVQSHKKPGCQKGVRPGGVRLGSHRRPPHFPGMDGGRPPHHVGGHRGKPFIHNYHGMHHHRRPSPVHRALQAVLFVLVPIFLGITMGMVVSLVGMMVGRLIAFLWTRFVRGGRRGYASVRLDEEDADMDDTSSVISEPLPKYEHAPNYEEAPAYEDAPAYVEKEEA